MSETPAISVSAAVRIGPGRLVLVVGPSGAGKDTLLNLARVACAGDSGVVFPRRVVTRAASQAEDNAQVSPDGFREALLRCEFAMHWEAHGHRYALLRAIEDDIRAGRTVVVNVSRTSSGWAAPSMKPSLMPRSSMSAPPKFTRGAWLKSSRAADAAR